MAAEKKRSAAESKKIAKAKSAEGDLAEGFDTTTQLEEAIVVAEELDLEIAELNDEELVPEQEMIFLDDLQDRACQPLLI